MKKMFTGVVVATAALALCFSLCASPALAKNSAKKQAQATKKEAIAEAKGIKHNADKSSKDAKKEAQALKKDVMSDAQEAKKEAYGNAENADDTAEVLEGASKKAKKAKKKGLNTRAFRMQGADKPINITGAAGRDAEVEELK